MVRRGFTVVELIITITIMGILMVLAVVNVNATQAQARDAERAADIEAITLAFEGFYKVGNASTPPGSYPSTATSNNPNARVISTLNDQLNIKSLLAPGINDETFKSFISATNTIQTAEGVLPQPDKDHYVYQPLRQDGAICTSYTQGCQKFNLYYFKEVDSTVHKVSSKNQ